jgi:Tfp pilus assembly protein PilF
MAVRSTRFDGSAEKCIQSGGRVVSVVMSIVTNAWRLVAFATGVVLLVSTACAAPFVPESDAVVLERLPEKGDPALAQLKRMRAALMANPRDLDIAVPVVERALEAARTLGDPRFLGQAQAALAPWWQADDAPPVAVLLRATLKQSQHDFAGSLADLDPLLAADPSMVQARLMRATVLTVLGRYADARRDCAALAGRVAPVVVIGCEAVPASLSGEARLAYEALVRILAYQGASPDVREWALTLAAEVAVRCGDFSAAELHFRAALALDPRDAYLKGAYADFLLDRDRPREVPPLLRDDTRNDVLLLRLALAEQRLPDQRDAFAAHRADLAARFQAAHRRGDSMHRREEARFRLAMQNDSRAAVQLARGNWAVQREPADLRILIEAARAAGDSGTLKIATDWISAHHLEDAVILAELARSR